MPKIAEVNTAHTELTIEEDGSVHVYRILETLVFEEQPYLLFTDLEEAVNGQALLRAARVAFDETGLLARFSDQLSTDEFAKIHAHLKATYM